MMDNDYVHSFTSRCLKAIPIIPLPQWEIKLELHTAESKSKSESDFQHKNPDMVQRQIAIKPIPNKSRYLLIR